MKSRFLGLSLLAALSIGTLIASSDSGTTEPVQGRFWGRDCDTMRDINGDCAGQSCTFSVFWITVSSWDEECP